MYDLSSTTPTYFEFSNAKTNDIEKAKNFEIISNTTYVMDRAYMDFNRWHETDTKKAYFVTRLKKNNAYKELTKIQATNSKICSPNNKFNKQKNKHKRNNKQLLRTPAKTYRGTTGE